MQDIPKDKIADDFIRQKTPQFMFQMPLDDGDSIFVSGKYRGVGSVMKFYKRNAALRWHAQLDTMTRVDAIALR